MIVLKEVSIARGVQPILERASVVINPGVKAGLIGRNGCGKSSLFALLLNRLPLDAGNISMPTGWRIAHMAQEVSASERSALEYVLDGDTELRCIERMIAEASACGDGEALAARYAELEAIDGYDAHYRAEQLLHGLGFSQQQCGLPVNSFSGGWRIRLNLAQALIARSDLLLLDEPTNHLDLEATLWLEGWLRSYSGTLLLISHDRDFLDNVVKETLHIENRQLNHYRGNYSAFERMRAEKLALQQSLYEKQQRRIVEIEDFVRRFRAKATKAKQAQSRLKELERMEQIALAHVDSPFTFCFLEADKQSSPLLVLQQADIGYEHTPILRQIAVNIQPGMRIGLLGVNGAGKSTLIRALVGDLPPLAGSRVAGEHLRIGYFAQHQLESLDVQASALLHVQRLSPTASEQEIRNFLGSFDFHGDKALEPVAPFSGGEKARLALALVVWQRPNLLLLDEPTNHLDLDMREALTQALMGYSGALIVISHDRHLLKNTVDQYWWVNRGTLTEFDGTLEEYHKALAEQQQASAVVTARPAEAASDKRQQRQQAAAARQQLAPLKKALARLENKIAEQQAQLSAIEAELADATVYNEANKPRLQQLIAEQGNLRKLLAQDEEQWFALQEQLEQQ